MTPDEVCAQSLTTIVEVSSSELDALKKAQQRLSFVIKAKINVESQQFPLFYPNDSIKI